MLDLSLQHRFELITARAAEPVTVTDAKKQMRIEQSNVDALIARLINVAIGFVDVRRALGKAMITQTWGEWLAPNPSVVYLSMGLYRASQRSNILTRTMPCRLPRCRTSTHWVQQVERLSAQRQATLDPLRFSAMTLSRSSMLSALETQRRTSLKLCVTHCSCLSHITTRTTKTN